MDNKHSRKSLAALLEDYDNPAEEFYLQMKRYYQTGIVTSVSLPFTPEEVKQDPKKVAEYITKYKLISFAVPDTGLSVDQIISLLFEFSPCLFEEDEVQINILDEVIKLKVPPCQLDLESSSKKLQSYTIKVTFKKSGAKRSKVEANFNRQLMAQHLKSQLTSVIYSAVKELLYDDTSDNPEADLKMANEVARLLGVKINKISEVELLVDPPQTTDLGIRNLEFLYILTDLLKDESYWLWGDIKDLESELKSIVDSRRQARIDSPIITE